MTKKEITTLYRKWRNENRMQKPNRVIVKMHWEDEPDNQLVDTIAITEHKNIGNMYKVPSDDACILFYVSSLSGLFALLEPDNGSDFVVDEVLEFWKK